MDGCDGLDGSPEICFGASCIHLIDVGQVGRLIDIKERINQYANLITKNGVVSPDGDSTDSSVRLIINQSHLSLITHEETNR